MNVSFWRLAEPIGPSYILFNALDTSALPLM